MPLIKQQVLPSSQASHINSVGSQTISAGVKITQKIVEDAALISEAAILGLCALGAFWLYPVMALEISEAWYSYVFVTLLTLLIYTFSIRASGLHRFDVLIAFDPFACGHVLLVWLRGFLILLAIGFVLKQSDQFSRGWILLWFASACVMLVTTRYVTYVFLQKVLKKGQLQRRAALVMSESSQSALGIFNRGDLRINVVGAYRADFSGQGDNELKDLIRDARTKRIDEIMIIVPWDEADLIEKCRNALNVLPVDLWLVADPKIINGNNAALKRIGDMSFLEVGKNPLKDWAPWLKSIEDRLISAFLISLFFLPMLLIGLLIRAESPGPILFRQTRKGFNDRTFDIYKFRTMHHDQCDDGSVQAVKGDKRITRIGALLRKTSLDELPQFFNVLKGDMSLVGPRPHPLEIKAADYPYHEIVADYAARHKMKPGITGWAQVNGWRGETTTVLKARKRIEHDLFYIDHWSFWFDVKILLLTPIAMLRMNNAY